MKLKFKTANKQQLEAINSLNGPLLIVAGPGTGKTFTLINRALNLIVNYGVKPEEILFATFTEKAANELITRLSLNLIKTALILILMRLDVLYRSKNVEVQGSGIRKVLELCAVNNIKYEYYNNEFGFRFSFHRNNATVNVTKNVTSDVTIEAQKRVNKLDFEVLRLLKENPVYTREEIAQKVGKTARTVQRALDRLKEDGKIVRIGNKVSGYWEVI